MHEIEAIVREVVAKTGPITNEYIADTMRRITTLCALDEETEGHERRITAAREVIEAVQARNATPGIVDVRTGATTASSEDPQWKQRIQALGFALDYYGVQHTDGTDRIRVHADVRNEYPMGGTPVPVLRRAAPAKQDLLVEPELAEKIQKAFSPEVLPSVSYAPLLAQAIKTKKPVHITLTWFTFSMLLAHLYANARYGWPARRELLSRIGITEI